MFAMSGMRLQTVKHWLISLGNGCATRRHRGSLRACTLSKHADHLKSLRNYLLHLLSMALQGVLRKHNVKHSKSDMHKKTVSIPRRPRTMDDFGRALAGASGADIEAF